MPAELWIIAGPNGAGKSTIAQLEPIQGLLHNARLLNPDDRTLEIVKASGYDSFPDVPADELRAANVRAATEVFNELQQALETGEKVIVETVLSSDKYKPVVEQLKSKGGACLLIYVGLNSPDLACRRVRTRVAKGGHDVPQEKIHSRWLRSLQNLNWFAERADAGWVFDNSDSTPDTPYRLIATISDGKAAIVDREANPPLANALESTVE